jgi:hypothetical protein
LTAPATVIKYAKIMPTLCILIITAYLFFTAVFHSIDMLIFKQESGKAALWGVVPTVVIFLGWFLLLKMGFQVHSFPSFFPG